MISFCFWPILKRSTVPNLNPWEIYIRWSSLEVFEFIWVMDIEESIKGMVIEALIETEDVSLCPISKPCNYLLSFYHNLWYYFSKLSSISFLADVVP